MAVVTAGVVVIAYLAYSLHGSWSAASPRPSLSASVLVADPPPVLPAAYTQAISEMTAYCTQDPAELEAMVTATHEIEVKAGVTGESETQLAVDLEKVVAANDTPSTCADEFAAYATLRTEG